MEKINQVMKGLKLSKSQGISQNTSLQTIRSDNTISIYTGSLDTKVVVEQTAKIEKAFPALSADFYDILGERLKANNFSNQRLIDAVNNLIDNFNYPSPKIADIISFDKRIKLYNYTELVKLVNERGPSIWSYYKAVKKVGIKRLYASIEDIDKYNLEVL